MTQNARATCGRIRPLTPTLCMHTPQADWAAHSAVHQAAHVHSLISSPASCPTFQELYARARCAHAIAALQCHKCTTHAGCAQPRAQEGKVYDCAAHAVCHDGPVTMYGWGKNAPAFDMPPSAGIAVGAGTAVEWIVLQVCTLHPTVCLCAVAH